MLKWLRKLFARTPAPTPSASLLDIARSHDEEKTRQVLAKAPIKKPTHILARILDNTSPKPVKPSVKRGPSPPTNIAVVLASEAANQVRHRGPSKPAAQPGGLVNMVKAIEDAPIMRKPVPKPQAAVPLAQLNTEQEARLHRRVGPATPTSQVVPPVAEWSRKQQLAATGGRPPPARPDNSGLHAALSKEDAILRAMAARSAAKEAREKKTPETALDQVKANKALAVKSKVK